MTSPHQLGVFGAALLALLAPAGAAAQEAAPVTQQMEMDVTPALLGLAAIVVVLVAFVLARKAFRKVGVAGARSSEARESP